MGKALIFCGIKHCGKSSVGRALSEKLRLPFADTDAVLEKKYGLSVREIFRKCGAETFRAMESRIIAELDNTQTQVIALGGGALMQECNRPVIRELGTLIWCDVDDETAFQRVKRGGLPPFLAESPDPFAEFCRSNKERRQVFADCADVHFCPDPAASAVKNAANLLHLLEEKGVVSRYEQ